MEMTSSAADDMAVACASIDDKADDRRQAASLVAGQFADAKNLNLAGALDQLDVAEDEAPLFADLGLSLYLFIVRLHARVEAEGLSDLYFLSREGYALKAMFEDYNRRQPTPSAARTHYLEASRRSSFLPSLRDLSIETFDVLFRQYRSISVTDFLTSLALELHLDEIAQALGVTPNDLHLTSTDLTNDPLFRRLLACPRFREIYDQERNRRSDALATYVASLSGGTLPTRMAIVDVGWKGSIQDNLWNWLHRRVGDAARIDGYYIGLIAPGASSPVNTKHGLLFSSQGGLSPGFRIFNENRSLFEVLLPAFHGGPRSYETDSDGMPLVLHDVFIEEAMIEKVVEPVYGAVYQRFLTACDLLAATPVAKDRLLDEVLRRHARMVFQPTEAEIQWLLSVSHVENFGVFEQSNFGNTGHQWGGLGERLRFTMNLLLRLRPSEMGFWPYLTLRQRAMPGTDVVYSHLRQWQSRKRR